MGINWNQMDEWARKSLSGDKQSYRHFLESLGPYLKARIRKTIPDHYREDAFQEILLAIHKSLKSLDPSKPVRPWVNAIAHHKVLDFLRSIYKDSQLEYEAEENLSDEHWDKVELQNSIEQLISPLSDTEKNVLMLLKYKEHSVKEVSKMLGLTESNVKVISFRAIRKLRENILQREFHE